MSGISGIDDDVGDELCPLCFEQMEPLTFRLKGRTRVVCCGKFICNSCAVKVRDHEHEASARFCSGAVGIAQSLRELKQSGACPFCRAQFPRTPKETLQKVLENAKQGHAWAQYTAGIMYTKGEGAPDGVNLSEARSWFEKAAKQGHSLAMCYYGVRLLEDLKDVFQAKVWYEKSIQVDVNPEACVLLGKRCITVPVEFHRILARHFDCSSSLLTKVLTEASVWLGYVTRWVLMVVVFQAVIWKNTCTGASKRRNRVRIVRPCATLAAIY